MHQSSFTVFFAMFLPLAGFADTSQFSGSCSGLDVSATAPEPGLYNLICRTASDQIARLGTCGILQARPITVAAVPAIEGLPSNCVGAFSCESDEIEVVLPETLASRDAHDFIYKGLRPEAAFVSILRHELSHALLEQTTEDRPIGPAAHEYISFAFQIDAMNDKDRAIFLKTNGQRPAKSLDTFNMVIYDLVPGRFASAAWLHFSVRGNGCDFVQDVIEGRVLLGMPHSSP